MKQINPEIETRWSRRLLYDAAAVYTITAVGSVRLLSKSETETVKYKLDLNTENKKTG